MNNTNKIAIGTGIYTVSDISLILKINKTKVRAWLKNYWDNSVVKSKHGKVINFLTLIEIYVFNTLLENGVQRKKIIAMQKNLSQQLKTDYPFAHNSFYYANQEVYAEIDEKKHIASNMNYILSTFIIPFAQKIEFAPDTQIATCFYPAGQKKNIVVNPEIMFGSPTIKGTRISTSSVYDFYKAGNSINLIANIYEIPKQTVKDIISFHKLSA